ncbi:CaiB/BaiF CoA transferase family protein [Brevibacillus marinus]|uniref:CaiB/BaiF CoA transferase family protein n=1 Tax=Brevibacillus marinus TaxID=2496837 RepID=UPI000F821568|nr:CoA transferase [Brevibacillus marinus]
MLSGTTVVDFTRYLPGSYCTLRLAEMGAEVIKIEAYPFVEPWSWARQHSGLNKRSAALNLHTAAGRELAFALAAQADVVVESFRPGVMRHLGLDYASLVEAKPDLIYCSLTGYGQSGSMYQLGGHDLNYQAVSGFLAANRDSEGRPVIPEIPLAGFAAGLYAAEQICAALVRKERTGQGANLDVAAVDILASWTRLHGEPGFAGLEQGMLREFAGGLLNYNVYETADGRFVALAALEEKYWHNFCHAVGREDWEDCIGQRVLDAADVYEELKALFLTRTQVEWNELGMEVDCCLTAVEELDTELPSLYDTSRERPAPIRRRDRRQEGQSEQRAAAAAAVLPGRDTHDLLRSKLSISAEQLRRYVKSGIIPEGDGHDEATERGNRIDSTY